MSDVRIPEFYLVVLIVKQYAIIAVGIFEAAKRVVAGGMIATPARWIACCILLGSTFGASVDMYEDDGVTLVNERLRNVERVKAVRMSGVVKLPDDRFDLIVGCVVFGDEGDGVGGLMEELEGWRWG